MFTSASLLALVAVGAAATGACESPKGPEGIDLETAHPWWSHPDGTGLRLRAPFGSESCPLFVATRFVASNNGLGHRMLDYLAGVLLALRYGAVFLHREMPEAGSVHGDFGGNAATFLGLGAHDPHWDQIVARDGARVVEAREMAYAVDRRTACYGYEGSDGWLAAWLRDGGHRCGDVLLVERHHNDDIGPARWLLARRYRAHAQAVGRPRPQPLVDSPCACHVALHYRMGDRSGVAMSSAYALQAVALVAGLASTLQPRLPVVLHVLTDDWPPDEWLHAVRELGDGAVLVHGRDEMTALGAFHFFTEADVLVMSRSSLSYVAAVFSMRPIVLAPPPFRDDSYPFRYCSPGSGFICLSENGTTASDEDARLLTFHVSRLHAARRGRIACHVPPPG